MALLVDPLLPACYSQCNDSMPSIVFLEAQVIHVLSVFRFRCLAQRMTRVDVLILICSFVFF
jgi:hypothetical protein